MELAFGGFGISPPRERSGQLRVRRREFGVQLEGFLVELAGSVSRPELFCATEALVVPV